MRILTAAFFALAIFSSVGAAEEPEPFFSYRLIQLQDRPHGLYSRQLVSVLLPGFDQWMEGQYRSAAVYSGYAGLGLVAALSAMPSDQLQSDVGKAFDDKSRLYLWGNQAYMDAGFVSAFHSFRKAAETHKAEGRFLFLSHEETAGDLMLAPFRLDYLAKPKVAVPLLLLGGLLVADSRNHANHYNWRGDDFAFGAAVSANAGIGEEAFFRGYMMPMMYDMWGSGFWSDVATATVFAAAHISGDNPVPWPQFLMGLYLGWNVQSNEWRLSQSVFLHTWWDILAISSDLAYNRGQAVHLPIFRAEF